MTSPVPVPIDPPSNEIAILLVDDQPSRLLSYEAILRELGYRLVTAGSGVEALEKLMREEFAVILLDVSMPGMDGFETAAMIHDHPRFERTPIIFVTALHVTDLDRLRGYDVGAVDYVYVPVVPEVLRGKVSVLAELYSKRKELQDANRRLEQANAELAAANSTLHQEKTRELERANAVLAETNATLEAEIAERQRLEEALVEADARKDEFLALLAHELRNPLVPIVNAVQLMHMRPIDDAQILWCRDVIARQTQHLTRLVEDLVDVSRITQGKITLQREVLDLEAVVQRAIEINQPIIEARGHRLIVDLPDEPVQVLGDLTRLVQIVGNLVNNAAKYTADGGSIGLSLERDGEAGAEQAVLRVRDNGVGIPPEQIGRVFELFTQVDCTLDRAHGGLGIGLALVRRLVDLHGGTVSARSDRDGGGSEFEVRLPAVRAAGVAAPAEPVEHDVVDGAQLRVLIADDNVDSAESLALLLRMLGHTVTTAHDGRTAIELANEHRPDVLVLDLGMPEIDGLGVARRIRAEPWGGEVLLVAVTGWGGEDFRQRTREAGFDAHLVKPVDLEALLAIFAENRERRRVQDPC